MGVPRSSKSTNDYSCREIAPSDTNRDRKSRRRKALLLHRKVNPPHLSPFVPLLARCNVFQQPTPIRSLLAIAVVCTAFGSRVHGGFHVYVPEGFLPKTALGRWNPRPFGGCELVYLGWVRHLSIRRRVSLLVGWIISGCGFLRRGLERLSPTLLEYELG